MRARFSGDAIDAYLAHRTIPAPHTVFTSASRLPPAHWLRYDLASGRLETREYWRPEPSSEAWLPTLDAAIRMRTVADRPLGLFLSSGVDSSAIACRLAAMGFNRLQSFTAAFPGTAFDESAEARASAARLGFPNMTIAIPQDVAGDFARLIADLDEPFADPSSVPTWYLARETTRHVKVVLGGDGGDELFGGYKRYAKHLRTRWRRGIVLPSLRAPAATGGRALQRLSEEIRLDWHAAYTLRFSGFTPGERAYLAPDAIPRAHYWRMPDVRRADLATLLEIDRLNYLPEYILRKADLCTMAHGLEMRAPLLDHRFVSAVCALPDSVRFTTSAAQAAGERDVGAGRARSVRAEEARLQPAAHRMARRRPRAAPARSRIAATAPDGSSPRRGPRRRLRPRVSRRPALARRAAAAARDPGRIAGAAGRARRVMTPVPHTLARYALFGCVAMYMLADLLPGRRKTPPAAPRRILIAHHLLLGDTIMLTPLVAKCRERWPDAEIVMTCPTDYIDLFGGRPYGVRILRYDRSDAGSIMSLLAQPNVDLALVPGDNRMSWLARAKNARWVVAFAGDSPAYKDWPVDELRAYPDVPMAWGDLVAGLVDGPAPRPFRTSDWPAPDAAPFPRPDAPYCVLHIGASTPLKRWPAERWRMLAERLRAKGYTVALTAGREEAQLLDSVDPAHECPRFGGTLTLAQMWHLLAGAALLVCPDTGIAHLARLIGVPTVALFGPGSALLSGAGDFWRDAPFTALTIPDFPCRDQRITMKREVEWLRRCERLPGDPPERCPQALCMNALTPDLVWQAVVARLGETNP